MGLKARDAGICRLAALAMLAALAAAPSSGLGQASTGRVFTGQVTPDPAWAARLQISPTNPIQFVVDDNGRITGRIRLLDRSGKSPPADGALTGQASDSSMQISTTIEPTDPNLPADVRAQARVTLRLQGEGPRAGVVSGTGVLNMIDVACVASQSMSGALSFGAGGRTQPCPRNDLPVTWQATGSTVAGTIPSEGPSGRRVKILKVAGDVEILRNGAGQPDELTADTVVSQNDRIITGLDSTVTVELSDGHVVTVSPVTDLKLDELDSGPQGVRTRLWLKAGEISADLMHKAQTKADFQVKTPTATLGVRGTRFTARHQEQPASLTTLKVTEGAVEFTPDNPKAPGLLVSAGGEAELSEHNLHYDGAVQQIPRPGQPFIAGTPGPPPPLVAQPPSQPSRPVADAGRPVAAGGSPNTLKMQWPQVQGYPLSDCVAQGVGCGRPAADAFCRSLNYPRSLDFQVQAGATPARRIGDGGLCSSASCGRFSEITCLGEGGPH